MARGDASEVDKPRMVIWFSCGAASACAAKIATTLYKETYDVHVVYCNTLASEHPDNARFLSDVENWLGQKVEIISSKKFANVTEVWNARKYMAGIAGAPCTVEMKKIPRFNFQRPDDIHVFGFTAEEIRRRERFEKNNPELNLLWILRDHEINREQCYKMLKDANIVLPTMYSLGYKNNNCIGCVKATSAKYWAMIRKDFPQIFQHRADQSRRIGARLVKLKGKRIFLDELPPGDFKRGKLEDISCGPECGDVNAE